MLRFLQLPNLFYIRFQPDIVICRPCRAYHFRQSWIPRAMPWADIFCPYMFVSWKKRVVFFNWNRTNMTNFVARRIRPWYLIPSESVFSIKLSSRYNLAHRCRIVHKGERSLIFYLFKISLVWKRNVFWVLMSVKDMQIFFCLAMIVK